MRADAQQKCSPEPFEDVPVQRRLADRPEPGIHAQVADLEVARRIEDGDLLAAVEPRLGEMRADEPGAARDQDLHAPSASRMPGRRPRRTAQASAGSSMPLALWTRTSRSVPSPVATVMPRDGAISRSVPGAAPFASRDRADPAHSQRRAEPSPTNAPGNGCVTARIMLLIRVAGHAHSTRPSSGRRRGTIVARAWS